VYVCHVAIYYRLAHAWSFLMWWYWWWRNVKRLTGDIWFDDILQMFYDWAILNIFPLVSCCHILWIKRNASEKVIVNLSSASPFSFVASDEVRQLNSFVSCFSWDQFWTIIRLIYKLDRSWSRQRERIVAKDAIGKKENEEKKRRAFLVYSSTHAVIKRIHAVAKSHVCS